MKESRTAFAELLKSIGCEALESLDDALRIDSARLKDELLFLDAFDDALDLGSSSAIPFLATSSSFFLSCDCNVTNEKYTPVFSMSSS